MNPQPFTTDTITTFGLETDPKACLSVLSDETKLFFHGHDFAVTFNGKAITKAPKLGKRALAGINAVIAAILAGRWHNHTVSKFDLEEWKRR